MARRAASTANSSLQVTGNKLIDDDPSCVVARRENATSVNANVSNNTLYGLGTNQILSGTGTASSNTFAATEPSYSTALADLHQHRVVRFDHPGGEHDPA